MKAIVHGGIAALLIGLLAHSARADYIAAETVVLRPEVPAGAPAPISFNFGASAAFTTGWASISVGKRVSSAIMSIGSSCQKPST